ncbi:hypothetical protein ACFVH0_32420 [Streptomyces sp. NPDC127117]|uniref:hypothetical protein n=1 Tax=Streptomyces sp. NPDC127117 TaxID=3345368 RepID=UPI0036416852
MRAAVFHLVQPHEPPALTDLAVRRYRSYASDLPWARDKFRDLLDEDHHRIPNPEYVLSLYWLTSVPWTGDAYDTALRLLSTPSVLVDRGAQGGPAPLDGTVEASLLGRASTTRTSCPSAYGESPPPTPAGPASPTPPTPASAASPSMSWSPVN